MPSSRRPAPMIPALVGLALLAACTGSERVQPAADSEVVLVVDELLTATPRPAPSSRTDLPRTTASPLPHPVEEKALRRALAAAFDDGPRSDAHGHLQRPVAGVRHALR